jgi:DNA replicative helicase MCM subunit Mcm2 (Cdc46/Mcm family)
MVTDNASTLVTESDMYKKTERLYNQYLEQGDELVFLVGDNFQEVTGRELVEKIRLDQLYEHAKTGLPEALKCRNIDNPSVNSGMCIIRHNDSVRYFVNVALHNEQQCNEVSNRYIEKPRSDGIKIKFSTKFSIDDGRGQRSTAASVQLEDDYMNFLDVNCVASEIYRMVNGR